MRRKKMSNFYEAISFKPTPKQIKLREQKVVAAIAYLGDKYLLAKPVDKLK
jgi:hypothetical protein